MTKDIDNATLRLAIHDPLQLPEKDFLNTFVARHTILKRLTRHVRDNTDAQLLQHRLIFGQRGMGKTSLLRRLAISVKDDPSLSNHWIPLNFREEQYNIGKLDHFWLNCADALADWCEKQGDAESAQQLDMAIGTGKNPYEIIQKTIQKYNRRLLLLVDNLNLILDSLTAPDQWALREKLQAENAPLMIACTPSHVPQLADRKGAFYDFFAMDDLKPMTPAEMGECLTRLARTRGEPGARVLEDMRRYPERIRVMHTLCGGNPRTLVLIYQVLETIVSSEPEEKDRMGQLLEGVLENATPLYKARTEELPQQQRRIIDAIALGWDPMHSSTISEKTGLAPSSLSPQLKRLLNDGFLRQVPLGPKRKGYQLAERFYNIWYLMRHGTRRNRLRLSWLSSFLATYYSDDELRSQARQFISRGNSGRSLYGEALMHAIEDVPLRNAMRHELTRSLIGWDKRSIRDLVPGEDYEPKLLNQAERQAKLLAGLRKKGMDDDKARQFTLMVAKSVSVDTAEKQMLADRADQLSEKEITEATKVFKKEKQELDSFLGREAAQALRQVFADGKLTSLDDAEGALAALAYSESQALLDAFLMMGVFKDAATEKLGRVADACAVTQPSKAGAWNNLGILLKDHLKRYEESEQAFRKAIEIDPKHPYPWNNLGNLLMDHLKRYEESERAYRKAIEIDPKFAAPWNNIGNLLKNHLKQYDECERAFRKAIEIDPKNAYPWNGLGNLMQDHLKRYEESERAYLNAIEIDPNFPDPWHGLGNLMMNHLKRYEESEQAFRKAIEVDPKYTSSWNNLGNLLMNHLKQYEESERAFRKAIEVDPKYASSWNNLGILMQDHFKRYDASEQAYLKAIEIDPKYAYTWNNLGNLLQDHLKRYYESERAYLKAIEIDPKNAYPWNGLGNLLMNHLKRYEESEQAFRKAIEVDPKYASSWNNLGILLKNHLKRYNESEQAFRKAIEIAPKDAYPWIDLGNLMQDHLKRYDESEKAYLKAEEIDPKDQVPKSNRAWLALKLGRLQQAKELAEDITIPYPGKELLLAGCDLLEGNPGSCCDILEPVLEENPAALWTMYQDDLLRITRLVKKHHFEEVFLERLRRKQLHMRLEPYVAAAEAYFSGHERLLRLNPEARSVAEPLYDWLVSEDNPVLDKNRL